MTDAASLAGTLLAVLVIVVAQLLGGGSLGQLFQLTALLVVLGGTAGAVALSHSMTDLRAALGMVRRVYRMADRDLAPLVEEIVKVASVARKEGLLAIEAHRASIQDPLFQRSVKYVIDGFEPSTVREIMDAEIKRALEKDEMAAQVFESAGNYAPTMGVLGAVIGLVQVLSALDDPAKIGQGIAVAFVAILYGIGLSNLVFLPWAAKLRRKAEQGIIPKEIVKTGVIGIHESLSPQVLQEKLQVFLERKLEQ